VIGGGGAHPEPGGADRDVVGINVNLKDGSLHAIGAAECDDGGDGEKVGWVREGAGDRYDSVELRWAASAST